MTQSEPVRAVPLAAPLHIWPSLSASSADPSRLVELLLWLLLCISGPVALQVQPIPAGESELFLWLFLCISM